MSFKKLQHVTYSGSVLSFFKARKSYLSSLLLIGSSVLTVTIAVSVSQAQTIIDNNETVSIPGLPGASWSMNELRVGETGLGALEISGGGTVSSRNAYVGHEASSSGKITLMGSGARWTNIGQTMIGRNGVGELVISGGAIATVNPVNSYTNTVTSIGRYDGSSGKVIVTGAGSRWDHSYGVLYVASEGDGELVISNGGVVTSNEGAIGYSMASDSTGRVTVTGVGSRWDITLGGYYINPVLRIGGAATGHLTISDGGVVTASSGAIGGYGSTVTVTGAGSQWLHGSSGTIGFSSGTATLTISDGGTVINGEPNPDVYRGSATRLGTDASSSGVVTITGIGSSLTSYQGVLVGEYGTGTLKISDGGKLITPETLGYSIIGRNNGSVGIMTVTGSGSQWINEGNAVAIGYGSTGNFEISDGGYVSSNRNAYIGLTGNGVGTVLVTGAGSRWDIGSHSVALSGLIIGSQGRGSLIIADSGIVSVPLVTITQYSNGTGILSIGAAAGQSATVAGRLITDKIQFGGVSLGNARILFNHTETDYVFDSSINNGADNAVGSGVGLVGAGRLEAIAGRTILNSQHGDFTGLLQMSGSGILQINSEMSTSTASVLAGGTLEGSGFVGDTTNAGTIAPGQNNIGTLTISGNYTGNNGTLQLRTVLGGDSSATDRLLIQGNVSGHTTVRVNNHGGLGGETTNGIAVIGVGGLSPDNAFSLAGDYVTWDGQQAVIAGAYAYTLHHRDTGGANGGEWYLTSAIPTTPPIGPVGPTNPVPPSWGGNGFEPVSQPRYSPNIPVYEQYPRMLSSILALPTLVQRVGNRYWEPLSGQTGLSVDSNGGWARMEANRHSSEAARSVVGSSRTVDQWKLQPGFEAPLYQANDGSMLIAGVSVSYGTADAKIKGLSGSGKIDTNAYGVAASLTWYDASGFYADAQAQHMWFDSDLTSTTTGRKLVQSNNATGYALSFETGWRYRLTDAFSLTPQMQLAYSDVRFDSFIDIYEARVNLRDSDSLRLRLGLAANYETSWKVKDGTTSRAQVYGIANLYNEFLGGSRIAVGGTNFLVRDERLWTEIGIGGSYNWKNDSHSFYANANIGSSTRNFGNDFSYGGMIGYRMKW